MRTILLPIGFDGLSYTIKDKSLVETGRSAGYDTYLAHKGKKGTTDVDVTVAMSSVNLLKPSDDVIRGPGGKIRVIGPTAIAGPTACLVGQPLFHWGTPAGAPFAHKSTGGPIANLNTRFVDDPFADAAGALRGPLAATVAKARLSGQSSERSAGEPDRYAGHWLFFIEYPVNDPALCELASQESALQANGAAIVNTRSRNRTGMADIAHGVGKYAEPSSPNFPYALVYADVRGWTGVAAGRRMIERVVQRVSVFDKRKSTFLRTALMDYQIVLDTRDRTANFVGQVVGASEGQVDPAFTHAQPLSAASRFCGIPLPGTSELLNHPSCR